MSENMIKMSAAVTLAAILSYFIELLVPLILVVIIMLFDYISGIVAASVTGEWSSRIGILGIIKKVGQCAIIAVGVIVDLTIKYAAIKIGLDIGNFHYFALLICIWLIANECISILENIARAGLKHPQFLDIILSKMKNATEQKKNSENTDEKENSEGK